MTMSSTGGRDATSVRGTRPTRRHHLAAAQAADRFDGLPDGLSRWSLIAALRTAAPALGLTRSMVALAEHYVAQTFDADWQPGGEPIVIRPLTDTAAALALSERQIRNLEAGLAERGLLIWRDSGNHRRFGRRDPATGRLLQGYGPSLAPLAARASEIMAAAARLRKELRQRRQLRAEIAALRRRLHAAQTALAEAGLPAPRHSPPPTRLDARLPLATLETLTETLRRDTAAMEARLLATPACTEDTADRDIAALAEIDCRHYEETSKENPRTKTTPTKADIDPQATLISAFMHRTVEQHCMPGTDGLDEAGEQLRWMCGIDMSAWRYAQARMGQARTSLSVMLIATRMAPNGNNTPIDNPSAYLQGMVRRHESRRLDLAASVAAIMRSRPNNPTKTASVC